MSTEAARGGGIVGTVGPGHRRGQRHRPRRGDPPGAGRGPRDHLRSHRGESSSPRWPCWRTWPPASAATPALRGHRRLRGGRRDRRGAGGRGGGGGGVGTGSPRHPLRQRRRGLHMGPITTADVDAGAGHGRPQPRRDLPLHQARRPADGGRGGHRCRRRAGPRWLDHRHVLGRRRLPPPVPLGLRRRPRPASTCCASMRPRSSAAPACGSTRCSPGSSTTS